MLDRYERQRRHVAVKHTQAQTIRNKRLLAEIGSSGLAMPGVELRIVDEAGTILAEPGKTGRLEVRMLSVCAGYRAADDKPSDPPQCGRRLNASTSYSATNRKPG